MTSALPRSFYGKNEALAISRLEDFGLQAKGVQMGGMNTTGKSFEDLYDQTSSQLLNKTGKESFEAMKILKGADPKNYQPTAGVQYPVSKLGNALKQIAMLIKMEVGIEIAFAESGGWDTHFNQGAANGILARNLKDFSDCIAAFYKDLGNYQDEVTLMTMTEFGRTVKQNGTGGTDHGRASCLMVLGNDTAGGKIHHNIKSLAVADLEDGRDLPVTTDFRSVFAIVAGKHLGLVAPQKLFSDWSGIPMAELMR